MIRNILLAIFIVNSACVNMQLPKLIKTSYEGYSLPSLNVTMGEKFSLPLPHFDTPFQKKSFRIFQVPQEDFKKFSPVKEQSSQSSEQDKTKLQPVQHQKQVGVDYVPFDCNLSPGKIYFSKEIKSIREQYSRSRNSVWQENQYIHLSFRSLLYILKVETGQITAYIYNDISIDKVVTYKINDFVQREESMGDLSKSPPVIALSTIEDSLYLFTSLGIWQIKTKTILTDVRKVQNLAGFDTKITGGLDKVLHGQEKVIIGLKRDLKVFIIPEQGQKYKEITNFKGLKDFYPQDICMVSNILYVLDYKKGVYVFTILADGEYTERAFIPFQSFGGNFLFKVFQNSIFINFNDLDGSKVAQINYNLEQQQHYLVRYIKSDDYICDLEVFSVLTDYQGRPYSQRYNEDSFDSFLFVLLNYDDIEIYPFNVDPRIITESYNGVKLKGNDIRKIFHTKLDKYIVITNELIKYVRITIEKPSITCKTQRLEKSSPSQYFRLELTSNFSSCEHKDHSLPPKRLFHQYCEVKMSYLLHLGDPQQSQFQRYMLFSAVVGVVVLFVCGLVCLMQWRNNKMVILGRLKYEIHRFRNRHQKMQPFTQENVEQKDIEIEMPVVQVSSEEQQ